MTVGPSIAEHAPAGALLAWVGVTLWAQARGDAARRDHGTWLLSPEATPHGFDVQFGDYLVRYLALADPAAALADLGQLPDRSIDGANSRG